MQSEDAVFTIGPYTFKPASKLLVDGGGGKIRLTAMETSIIKYLYRAGERVMTRRHQHDDRALEAAAAQQLAGLSPIKVGKADVEKDEIHVAVACKLQPFWCEQRLELLKQGELLA